MKCAILLTLILAITGSATAGDVVILKDGQEMSGTIISRTDKGIEIKVADDRGTATMLSDPIVFRGAEAAK